MADPDMALLERWCAGDHQAGQALFTRYFREIYRFFEYRVGGDADDLAQRTFLACVTAREQFRGLSSFRTFLFAIARHELYGYFRRAMRNDNLDFEVTSVAELGEVFGPYPELKFLGAARTRNNQQMRILSSLRQCCF